MAEPVNDANDPSRKFNAVAVVIVYTLHISGETHA